MKAAAALSVSDAMASPKLFAPFFAGDSWNTWRAVLKAAYAESLSVAELEAFRAVAERNPPARPVSETIAIAGRGAGKDSIASLIATVTAVNFKGKLRPGEKAVVMCLACDRDQASIVFNYIRGYFDLIPALGKLVRSVGSDSIELRNGVVIEVHSNSYRSVRGRSILCAIFDEVAFWRSEDSASPDFEVAGAVTPGLARVPGSTLILISSAHKRAGLLYERWKAHYGKADDDVLVVRGTTLQFNPSFDAKVIARQLASDPQLYGAEYNSQWRDDLATFISRELLEAAVDPGVLVRPPVDGVLYHAFADPSGGAVDSFTLAIAHLEPDGRVVLDLLLERRSPLNPYEVTKEIVAVMREYRCTACSGDSYAKRWVIDAFAAAGASYLKSDNDRSAIYLNVLPLFTSGRVRLLDSSRLVAQFAALERRTFSTGRDRVDHGRSGHDDAANACAGALVRAARPVLDEVRIVAPHVAYGRPHNVPGGSVLGTAVAVAPSVTPPAAPAPTLTDPTEQAKLNYAAKIEALMTRPRLEEWRGYVGSSYGTGRNVHGIPRGW